MPGRILFVDDEANFRAALQEWFLSHGYEVDGAADGQEAVEKFEQGTYDLVTLDLEMPRMNGFQAAKELRSRFPELPIIILTAVPRHAQDLDGLGVADVLLKPVSLRHLLARVQALLPQAAP